MLNRDRHKGKFQILCFLSNLTFPEVLNNVSLARGQEIDKGCVGRGITLLAQQPLEGDDLGHLGVDVLEGGLQVVPEGRAETRHVPRTGHRRSTGSSALGPTRTC